MSRVSLEEAIKHLEIQMWEAFSCGNSECFSELVCKEAMMICGGDRESGYEYTNIVAQVKLDRYELSDFLVKLVDPNTVLTNYIVKVQCHDPIISGTFRVSSLWIKNGEKWKLVFNQDSRLL